MNRRGQSRNRSRYSSLARGTPPVFAVALRPCRFFARVAMPNRLLVVIWGLPRASVVFLARQHVPDENHLVLEIDLDDEPVFIPTDIDHNPIADAIGAWAIGLQLREVRPLRLRCELEPPA